MPASVAAATGFLLGSDDEDRVNVARLGDGAVSRDRGFQLPLAQLHAFLSRELLLEDEVHQLRSHDVVGAGSQGVRERQAGAREVGIDVAGGQGGRRLGLQAGCPEVLELLAIVQLAARDVRAVDRGDRLQVALPEAIERARPR